MTKDDHKRMVAGFFDRSHDYGDGEFSGMIFIPYDGESAYKANRIERPRRTTRTRSWQMNSKS